METAFRKEVEEALLSNYEAYYRLAYSYTGNEADALDIIQESAYQAIRNAGSLKKPEFAGTWIYRIVVNTALDLLRKKKRLAPEEELSGSWTEDRIPDPDLAAALKELPEKDRTLLLLRFFEELSFSGISEILGENENTVKTRYYRLLERLRTRLSA